MPDDTVGGYQSGGRDASDLTPPPRGPAPGGVPDDPTTEQWCSCERFTVAAVDAPDLRTAAQALFDAIAPFVAYYEASMISEPGSIITDAVSVLAHRSTVDGDTEVTAGDLRRLVPITEALRAALAAEATEPPPSGDEMWLFPRSFALHPENHVTPVADGEGGLVEGWGACVVCGQVLNITLKGPFGEPQIPQHEVPASRIQETRHVG